MERKPKPGGVGKRVLSAVLALLMLATMLVIAGINGNAANSVNVNNVFDVSTGGGLQFKAPETIWLKLDATTLPGGTNYLAAFPDGYGREIEYYSNIDNTDGGVQTTGGLYFSFPGATGMTLTAQVMAETSPALAAFSLGTQLNATATGLFTGTITNSGGVYSATLTNNRVVTSLQVNQNTCRVIEWTMTFRHPSYSSGIQDLTTKAYSVVRAPSTEAAGAAVRTRTCVWSGGTYVYSSGVYAVLGLHRVSVGFTGSAYSTGNSTSDAGVLAGSSGMGNRGGTVNAYSSNTAGRGTNYFSIPDNTWAGWTLPHRIKQGAWRGTGSSAPQVYGGWASTTSNWVSVANTGLKADLIDRVVRGLANNGSNSRQGDRSPDNGNLGQNSTGYVNATTNASGTVYYVNGQGTSFNTGNGDACWGGSTNMDAGTLFVDRSRFANLNEVPGLRASLIMTDTMNANHWGTHDRSQDTGDTNRRTQLWIDYNWNTTPQYTVGTAANGNAPPAGVYLTTDYKSTWVRSGTNTSGAVYNLTVGTNATSVAYSRALPAAGSSMNVTGGGDFRADGSDPATSAYKVQFDVRSYTKATLRQDLLALETSGTHRSVVYLNTAFGTGNYVRVPDQFMDSAGLTTNQDAYNLALKNAVIALGDPLWGISTTGYQATGTNTSVAATGTLQTSINNYTVPIPTVAKIKAYATLMTVQPFGDPLPEFQAASVAGTVVETTGTYAYAKGYKEFGAGSSVKAMVPVIPGYDFAFAFSPDGQYFDSKTAAESYTMVAYAGSTLEDPGWRFYYNQQVSYTINFNLNGGSGTTPGAKTGMKTDSTDTWPGTTGFSNGTKIFRGWSTEPSGGGVSVTNTGNTGASPTIPAIFDNIGKFITACSGMFDGNRSITLYAIWENPDSTVYSVYYSPNGGTGSIAPSFTAPGSTAITIKGVDGTSPDTGYTREGYYFDPLGWREYGTTTRFTPGGNTINRNLYLEAMWLQESYNVTFDLNYAGAPASSPIPIPYGEKLSDYVFVSPPSYAGNQFLGWFTTATTGGTEFWDGESDKTMPDIGGNSTAVTYYARWAIADVAVKWNYNINPDEAENIIRTTAYTYDAGRQYKDPFPTAPDNIFPDLVGYREGYRFGGWATSKINAEGNDQFVPIDGAKAIDPDDAKTFYAIWIKEKYDVKFNYNYIDGMTGEPVPAPANGVGFDEDMKNFTGAPHNIVLVPSYPGYTFLGWAETAVGAVVWDGTSTRLVGDVSPGADTADGAEKTYYAKWVVGDVTVKWNYFTNQTLGLEDLNVIQSTVYTYGSTYSSIAPPVIPQAYRPGYRFAGWAKDPADATAATPVISLDADGAGVDGFSGDVTTARTFYAVWVKETYYVGFNYNYTQPGLTPAIPPGSIKTGAPPSTVETFVFGDNMKPRPFPVAMADSTKWPDGYVFLGWAESENGSVVWDGVSDSFVPDLTPSTDADAGDATNPVKTYFAKWGIGDVLVKFNYNIDLVETENIIKEISYQYDGSKYNTPAAYPDLRPSGGVPYRPGYIFGGWAETQTGTMFIPADGNKPVDVADHAPAKTVTYYAVWTKENYDITFDYNYNHTTPLVTGMPASQPANVNRTVSFDTPMTPLQPTVSGYVFLGWAESPGGAAVWDGVSAWTVGDLTPTTDEHLTTPAKTYYAKWDYDSVLVKFNYNIDLVETENIIKEISYLYDGRNYNNPPAGTYPDLRPSGGVPYRPGYIFGGWAETQDGTMFIPADGNKLVDVADNAPAKTVTYYAVWTIESYNIEFNYNYNHTTPPITGMPTPQPVNEPRTVNYNTPMTLLQPTVDGYVFLGWAESANGTAVVWDGAAAWTVGDLTPTTDAHLTTPAKTYYAKWKALAKYVEYMPNTPGEVVTGVTPVVMPDFPKILSQDSYDSGEAFNLEVKIFACAGFELIGWALEETDADAGIVDYALDEEITFPSIPGNLVLYAVWAPVEHSLIFHRNYSGSDGTVWSFTGTDGYYGKPIVSANGGPVPSTLPTDNTGYDFLGWFDASDNLVYAATPATVPYTEDVAQDVEVYAHWKAQSYTATWDYGYKAEGIDVKETSIITFDEKLGDAQTIAYPGDAADYPACPSRVGYDFLGWFTGPGGTGASVDKDTAVNTTGNRTYYAHWGEISYAVYLVQKPSETGVPGPEISLGSHKMGDVVEITLPPYGQPFAGFWRIEPAGAGTSPVPESNGNWYYTVTPPLDPDAERKIVLVAIYEGNGVKMIFDPNGGIFGTATAPSDPDQPKDWMTDVNAVVDLADNTFNGYRVSRHGHTFTGWAVISPGEGRFETAPASGVFTALTGGNASQYKAGSNDTILRAQWLPDTNIPPFDEDSWPETGDDDEEDIWPPHDEEGDPIDWPPDIIIPVYGDPYVNLPALGCFEEWHFLGYYEPTGRKVENGMPSQLAQGEHLSVVFARKYSLSYDANGGLTDRGEIITSGICVVYGHPLDYVCNVIPKGQTNAYKTTHVTYFPTATRGYNAFQGWFTNQIGGTEINAGDIMGPFGKTLLLRDDNVGVTLPQLTEDCVIAPGGLTYYAQWYHNRTWWDDVTEWFNNRYGTTGYNIPQWVYTCDLPRCLKTGLGISLPFLGALGFRIAKISNWSRGWIGFWGVMGLLWLPVPLLFSCIYPVIRAIMPGWWPDWNWHPFALWLWY